MHGVQYLHTSSFPSYEKKTRERTANLYRKAGSLCQIKMKECFFSLQRR